MWEYVLAREVYPLSAAAAAPQGTLAVARGPLQPLLADHAAPFSKKELEDRVEHARVSRLRALKA